ncbi:hypothetical protein Y032_0004g2060 [Ancylostoma ceylanicum]|uniref:Peptidase A2 domain-containing protein n=1 Tax=Ancylostoma ceylanicum TaxID=53326 RepID=A0A016VW48_9BILA|nr:hypothetical protein Y032_0004g2060 [Ancylostoma ceylanicum]
MALHFYRIPIILSARLLRTVVTHYTEYTKNVEYAETDDDSYEKCRTTIALLESGLRQIKEAKEDLLKLYREILDEHKNSEDSSEKRDILTEIHEIVKESELKISITEANDLIVVLTANLNKSKNTHKNMENFLGYSDARAQKIDDPTKDRSEIVQDMANGTEQNKNYVSFSPVLQTSYSCQLKCNAIALLKEENAANVNNEKRVCQKNNGRVTQSRAKHTSYRPNYSQGCIFCHKGNHSAIRCRTVSDQSMRRNALREQNRCWKCFSSNHNSYVCRKQDCSSCGQKHHSSLCFKKEPLQVNHRKDRRAIIGSSNKSDLRDRQNRDQRANNIQPSRTKATTLTVQMCTETVPDYNHCPLKTTNRQIVLMTAEGSIWNAKQQQFEKVLFCFDSGAQKTVIEEKLAEEFGLPKGRTQMCTVSGSGGHTETLKCHTVSLKIGTAFGEDIETVVETRSVITNGFPSVRLSQDDSTFLKANEIYLANPNIRGEHQIPRILVGLDYYHDLVTGHVTKTPSGLHVAKTVFGPTIYGSGSTEVSQVESVNYNLTAVWENTKYLALQKSSELGGLGTASEEHRKGGKSSKYSDEHTKEVFHAYGFTTSSVPLKEAATNVAKHHSVATSRLQSPRLQPSPANRSHHRPVLSAKPPSTPSSRRSPPTPAICRHPRRPRAVLRHRPRQEVNRRIMTRKKARTSDTVYGYSCRPPEYHRHIDDPCTHIHR